VNGVFADVGGRGGEVDEVTGVDDERGDVVFGAFDVEEFDLVFVGRFGAPHARAGGENLQGVGACCLRVEGGAFQRSAVVGVNADAHVVRITGRLRRFDIGTLLN